MRFRVSDVVHVVLMVSGEQTALFATNEVWYSSLCALRRQRFGGSTECKDATKGHAMNRAVNRLIARSALLGVAVVLGAFAVAHTQKGLEKQQGAGEQANGAAFEAGPTALTSTSGLPPAQAMPQAIPSEDFSASLPEIPDVDGYPPVDAAAPPVLAEVPSDRSQPVTSPPELPPPTSADAFAESPPEILQAQAEMPTQEEISGPAELTPLNDMSMATLDGVEDTEDAQSPNEADEMAMEENPVSDSPPAALVPDSNYYPQPDARGALPNDVTEDTYSGAATMDVGNPRDRTASRSRSGTMVSEGTGIEGNGKPGPDQLAKPQTPSLTIQKSAPSEVQVGKPAKLEITVKNIGSIPAEDVVIRDEVPAGTRLVSTSPAADTSRDGVVLWQMGTIEPNSEATAVMEVLPFQEGEIGSVASISFQVSTSSRSISTRPQLQLEHTGPAQVLAGDNVVFQIKVTNPGTGAATNVVVEEVVPEGLQHFDGREIEYAIGTLRPGEHRLLELQLKASKPGTVENILTARADSNIRVEDVHQFEVVAPRLEVKMEGPKRRFLDRKATVQIAVANPGTAAARQVELVAKLPRGVKFLSTNNAGQYDAARHTVSWRLEELPPGEMGTVEVHMNAVEVGRQEFRVEAKAGAGLSDVATHDITVEGMAALLFTVTDENDPIEIGGETTYDVQVINQGSKASTNLRLTAVLPEGMEAVAGEGPTRESINGRTIAFEPVARLAPQANANYRLKIRGTSPGDKRVQIKLMSDEIQQPVTKEESTHVYSDG